MTEPSASPETLRGMLAKAQEKLEAAKRELKAGYPGEAASRAYYAVFHAMSAVLASQGLAYASHAQVVGAFNKHFVKTGAFPKETTRQLQRLFEDRQVADYDWVSAVEEQSAVADVADAELILHACANFLGLLP